MTLRVEPQAPPPTFTQARNPRQKARAAGLDPDYWYAVELERNLAVGQVIEVVFWNTRIALFRGADGALRAIENRCAHRGLKLSLGTVSGCTLQCPYHGWKYAGDGTLAEIPHDMFGQAQRPQAKLRAYPVRARYGLLWLFPGNPGLADSRAIPDIPELDGPNPWACEPLSFTWNAHHSIIIDNVSDFTHEHLHRKYKPFTGAKLTRCEVVGDDVFVDYDTAVGRGRISGLFVDHAGIDTNHIRLCFQYPYQWSNTDEHIKHWLFILPIDERTSRAFFLFYFKSLKVPFTRLRIPYSAMRLVLKMSNRLLIRPLLQQDQIAVEAEQAAYEQHWAAPPIEMNPAVRAFQQVTTAKWQAYLDRHGGQLTAVPTQDSDGSQETAFQGQ